MSGSIRGDRVAQVSNRVALVSEVDQCFERRLTRHGSTSLTRATLLFGALLLGLLATSGGCRSSGASNSKRIILLTNGDSPYWNAAGQGLDAAAKELKLSERGLRAVLDTNDGTEQGQLDKLHQYSAQSDIAAVGISVVDATNVAIAEEMRKLQAKGIVVLAIDNDIDRSRFRDVRRVFIGTDNRQAGRELGSALRNLRPQGGDYVTFVGRTGAQNATECVQGLAEGAGNKFRSVDNMGDEFDPNKPRDNVRNAITNHPSVNTLVGIYSYNGPAICDVLRERKRRADFTTATFDADPTTIKDMEQGDLDVIILQNPYDIGYQAVRMMDALVEKNDATIKEMFPKLGQPDGDLYITGLKIVVPDQDTRLKKDMFLDTTEFMTLSQLKVWLKKYGLTGS